MKKFSKIVSKDSIWGIALINRDSPDTIYTATYGSPLLIGFSAEEDKIIVVS